MSSAEETTLNTRISLTTPRYALTRKLCCWICSYYTTYKPVTICCFCIWVCSVCCWYLDRNLFLVISKGLLPHSRLNLSEALEIISRHALRYLERHSVCALRIDWYRKLTIFSHFVHKMRRKMILNCLTNLSDVHATGP